MRKKRKIIVLCLLFCFAANPAHSGGGGGGNPGGATEATQLLNNAELIKQVSQLSEQIRNQTQQIQNEIRMVQDMVNNSSSMSNLLFRDVQGIYSRIKGVIDSTRGIAYNLANVDEEMKRRFRSYSDMSSISRVSDLSSEYRNIVNTQTETVRNTMRAIGVSYQELITDDASTLRELQSKARTASGRNQMIQATNQLLGFLAEDSMKLRQLQMIQAQMTGTTFEAERAREDLSNKRIEDFFRRGHEVEVHITDESLIDRIGR